MRRIWLIAVFMLGTWFSGAGLAQPAKVTVAVAANFAAPMKLIAADFERDTGYETTLSLGGTGSFYAQITNGAPFDVFLAADARTPALLVQEGLAVPGTVFTYATGKLVLWSKHPGLVDDHGDVLVSDKFAKLAVAEPKLAPYGQAAQEVMARLGLTEALASKLVQGKNIAQTFQFVSSGNAQLGFVALSQVFVDGKFKEGSGWIVPSSYHTPIEQNAVLLARGEHNEAALALIGYLKSKKARQVIESFGYQTDEP